jgi:hypothetical protein
MSIKNVVLIAGVHGVSGRALDLHSRHSAASIPKKCF